jgi:acyl-CoA thioester hydrolase
MERKRIKALKCITDRQQLRAQFPLVIEDDVAWGEMDAYQHVNNVVYFRYFENARVAYLTRSGWDEIEEETGVGIAVKRIEAAYHQALHYPCQIVVAARIPLFPRTGDDRFTMEYVVASVAGGGACEVAATGESENVLFNNKTKKKDLVTPEILALIKKFESGRDVGPSVPPFLIAVVGATGGASGPVLKLAGEAGRQVTSGGHVLLTGGQPPWVRTEGAVEGVKDAAMDGASQAATASRPARMIGILPRAALSGMTIAQAQNVSCLLVHTKLGSHERNYITGRLADAVIALQGQAGTLSELAFAHQAGRPIVFLDSYAHFQEVWRRSEAEVRQIAEEARAVFPSVDTEGYLVGLRLLLVGTTATHQAGDSSTAVTLAERAIRVGMTGDGAVPRDFPSADGRTVSRQVFDEQLQLFCA